ncbi:MAG: fumarylacetoacetate hydrolase family protein [Phycisphaerales bacterium]|nr:fumarylacetoacetate hydrolase family protein [Phycisphaerales bacterium]
MNHPPAIICIGRNYEAHAAEMGASRPDAPTVFMKNPAAVIANGDAILVPEISGSHGPELDYEGELAVILGNDLRNATNASAMDAIKGYAVANDVTARWWQKKGSGGQWIRGKSFDTFCPMTEMVPASKIKDPQQLKLVTKVNGEIRQDASTSEMIFPIIDLLVDLSRDMTLLSGTVLLTGTPEGVGAGRTPQEFLADGDVVEVEIPGIGNLCNPVKAR